MRNATPVLFAIVGLEIAVVIALVVAWLPGRVAESMATDGSAARLEQRVTELQEQVSRVRQSLAHLQGTAGAPGGDTQRLEKLVTGVHDDLARLRVILTPENASGDEGGAPEDINVPEYLDAVLERVNDIGTQIYEFERDHFRNLRQVQKNILEKLARLSGGGSSTIPEDPARVDEYLEAGRITLDRERRRVTLGATIANPNRPLELVAAIAGGPLHETLLEVDCLPSALWMALSVLGCDPGHGVDLSHRELAGARLHIYVSWDGQAKPVRLEDMLWNAREKAAMAEAQWLFTGSEWDTTFSTGQEYYVADESRVLIALTYNYSRSAVVSCAQSDAGDESVWYAHPDTLPEARDTALTLTISPEPVAEFE